MAIGRIADPLRIHASPAAAAVLIERPRLTLDHRATAESVSPDEPADKRRRSWNLALLTPTEPGRRNRRTVDAFFLVLGAIVAGLLLTLAAAETAEESVTRWCPRLRGWR